MSQVVDYSWARPGVANIKNAGYIGVMRYLSYDNTGKTVSRAEADEIRGAGLKLGLVWENAANRVKGGAAAGASDAQEALRQANALGHTGVIYFAIDYDAPESDQQAINDYFQACATVIGKDRLGCYAGYWPLKRLFDAGIITYGWQTVAWSGGNRESRAHLYQNGGQVFSGGADVNDVLKDNFTEGEEIMKPTEQEVYEAFRLFLGHDPANPDEVNYYLGQDKRELYYQVLFNGVRPKLDEVQQAFKDLQPDTPIDTAPYTDQSAYYQQHAGTFLYKDLAYGLLKRFNELKNKPAPTPPPAPAPTPIDPNSVVITKKGWSALWDTIKAFFGKNN